MGELILWLLILAGVAVVWIEWVPQRYTIFPQILTALALIPAGLLWLPYWYGWVTSLFGVATLTWYYFSPARRHAWPNLFMLPNSQTAGTFLIGDSNGCMDYNQVPGMAKAQPRRRHAASISL